MDYPNFEGIKHFKPSEFPEPEKMCRDLLLRLDALREYLGESIIITFSTNGTHAENSQHFLGRAVDFVVPSFRGSLLSLYLIIERFGFKGIGLYPKWRYHNKVVGGFHTDSRSGGLQGARWIGVLGNDGKNIYLPLNPKNLIEQGVLTEPK